MQLLGELYDLNKLGHTKNKPRLPGKDSKNLAQSSRISFLGQFRLVHVPLGTQFQIVRMKSQGPLLNHIFDYILLTFG